MRKIDTLKQAVEQLLGDKVQSSVIELDQLIITLDANDLVASMRLLRDSVTTRFEQCVDLCGVDYSEYADNYTGLRFAVVYQLLSLSHNWRLRVKTFAQDDDFPVINSLVALWNGLNWFEREAFDMFGIIFDGHPDLRRILTDYGFIGHPFRKNFPVSGFMEMKYDDEQKRVVYQPVTIEPREIIPRVIREEHYSGRD